MEKKAITLQQLEEALRDLTRWIREKLTGYLQEPAAEGQSGYVLTTNGAGGRSWEAVGEVEVDGTLSMEGAAADAAAVGTAIGAVREAAENAQEAANNAQTAANNAQSAADSTVSTAKIADKAVTNAKIATGAVTVGKIAGGAVSLAKLGSDVTAEALGGVVSDLLWTNASASSSFAAQTISKNLTGYSRVLVCFNREDGIARRVTEETRVGASAIAQLTALSNGSAAIGYNRVFSATTTGITFEAGLTQRLNTTTRTEDNTCLVPTHIYGIKGDA